MKKNLKCLFCFIFLLFTVFSLPMNSVETSFSSSASSFEEEFKENIDEQLEGLDFTDIEDIVNNIGIDEGNVFGDMNFVEKVKVLISGEFIGDFDNVWDLICGLFFDNILSMLPLVASIIAISILGGLVGNLKPSTNGKSIGNIIHFIIYGLIVVLLSSIIIRMIDLTGNTLQSIKKQIDVIFPILLTMLTAIGGTVSVSLYQPAIAMFSGFIISIFTNFLMPVFITMLILNLVSSLSNTVKLNKLSSFLNSLFKWVVGIVFTVFSSFITIQGLTAGAVDGMSIKTAKFTIRNSIPLVGNYISDGLFMVLASSNLIKNAVGGAGFLLLLATIISPLIQLILFMLALKFMAGVIEPLGDGKIASFVSNLAKSMTMLIVMIVCVSFMYMILSGLVMCSANIF